MSKTLLATCAAFLALCGTAAALPPFTTAPKRAAGSATQAEITAITARCHPTFDRFVLTARSGTLAYDVRYVSTIVHDASGNPVPLLGTKRLRVVVRNARAHTAGGAGHVPTTLTPRCSNLRQIKNAGDFEGVVTYGLGLSRTKGFRVFRLSGPTRLVIDVAH